MAGLAGADIGTGSAWRVLVNGLAIAFFAIPSILGIRGPRPRTTCSSRATEDQPTCLTRSPAATTT